MSDVFIARQPIMDRDREVSAYELLYQDEDAEDSSQAAVEESEADSVQLVLGALTEVGLDQVVGDQQAWMTVSVEFLRDGLVYSLTRGRVVLQLRPEQLAGDGLLELIGELRGAGYGVALREFRRTPEAEALLEHVDTVKLDLGALGPDGLKQEAERCRQHNVTVVVEGVGTPEEFELALEAGCDLFQGYFFCEPDSPIEIVVSSLPFPERIQDALISHSGGGRLLDCVQAIERGNFGRAARELAHPARDYANALAWANEIAREFGAEVVADEEPMI
jgi:EAL and modified HD-GYP domain-containing signal transduction protein